MTFEEWMKKHQEESDALEKRFHLSEYEIEELKHWGDCVLLPEFRCDQKEQGTGGE